MSNSEQTPRVSIVTPSFNRVRFLKPAMDSVFGQKYSYCILPTNPLPEPGGRSMLDLLSVGVHHSARIEVAGLKHLRLSQQLSPKPLVLRVEERNP